MMRRGEGRWEQSGRGNSRGKRCVPGGAWQPEDLQEGLWLGHGEQVTVVANKVGGAGRGLRLSTG